MSPITHKNKINESWSWGLEGRSLLDGPLRHSFLCDGPLSLSSPRLPGLSLAPPSSSLYHPQAMLPLIPAAFLSQVRFLRTGL